MHPSKARVRLGPRPRTLTLQQRFASGPAGGGGGLRVDEGVVLQPEVGALHGRGRRRPHRYMELNTEHLRCVATTLQTTSLDLSSAHGHVKFVIGNGFNSDFNTSFLTCALAY